MAQTAATIGTLRETVRAGAANRPGIYRMMGPGGVVLYVGKSKQVRTRLLGYFRAGPDEKASRILRDAVAIEWEYVPNEFASLLRELELIKHFRPPYNVRQKRDRRYSYLRISGGVAPRVHLVRGPRQDAASYYGPLRGGERLGRAVQELNDLLLLRDCGPSTPIRFADQSDLFGGELTPLCVRHELRKCSGPCAARCSAGEYSEQLHGARSYLEGRSEAPLLQLRDSMQAAAHVMAFEHAAILRERIERLEILRAEFGRLREAITTLTFLYTAPGHEGEHRVYAIRSGMVRAAYPAPRTARERRALLANARTHFEQPEDTAEAAAGRPEELLLVSHWFRTRPGEREWTFTGERWPSLPTVRQIDRMLPQRRRVA